MIKTCVGQPARHRSVSSTLLFGGLPVGAAFKEVLTHLIAVYAAPEPDHPMSAVLHEGLAMPEGEARRRGGRAARVPAV